MSTIRLVSVFLVTILVLIFGQLPVLAKEPLTDFTVTNKGDVGTGPINLPDYLNTLTPPDRRNGIISPSASVTIVTFEDYECEACAHTHKILKKLRNSYAGRINFIFRHYPIDEHPNALKAALAVEAAAEQGRFMQKHDELLENQSLVASLPEPSTSDSLLAKIRQDEADAKKLGVEGTPTTFVNGRNLGYVTDLETISKEIEKDILPVSISITFTPENTGGVKTGSITVSGNTSTDKTEVDVTTKLPITLKYESEGVIKEQTIPNDPGTVCRDASGCSIPVDFTVTNTGDVNSGAINLPGDPKNWKISAYDPSGQEIAIYNGGIGSQDSLWYWKVMEEYQKQEEENPFSPTNPQYIFFIILIILAILAWWKFRRR